MKGKDIPLPTPKCKRIVRPLISKLHSLTGLYSKYPDKFLFDVDKSLFDNRRQNESTNSRNFINPPSARERLLSLKPYLSAEVYEAYLELFNIFRSIVASLYPEQGKKDKKKPGNTVVLPRLSSLAAQKLGKSIALGTKTSYFSLSQTMLFDPTSIPRHLQKYHETLADDIDDWLTLDPLFSSYRPVLVLGYVLHMLVLNSAELLFMLVPVLVHWLHEEKLPWSRGLFTEFWLSSKRDPDHVDTHELKLSDTSLEPNLEVFWGLHRIGYWRQMSQFLGVSSPFSSSQRFASYDSLILDVMGCTDRMDVEHVAPHEVYELLVRNPQYPTNTTVLISVAAQLIDATRKNYGCLRSPSDALDLLNAAYRQIRLLVHTWLGLRNECVFNSVDRGNHELVHAVLSILAFLAQKSRDISAHYRSSTSLCDKFDRLSMRVQYLTGSTSLLYAFFMEEHVTTDLAPQMARYLYELAVSSSDDDMLIIFMDWLHEHAPTALFNDLYDLVASSQNNRLLER